MLKKIDCIMVKVPDVHEAAEFYHDVFGLKPNWEYDQTIGMKLAESGTEIVLHSRQDIPFKVDVTYLVDSVDEAIIRYEEQGCTTIKAPFDIRIGRCAVIMDPFGISISILDMTKGEVVPNL